MTAQTTFRARVRRLVVIALVLVLTGAGAAAAYWTATTQLTTTSSTAAVGLEQTLPSAADSPLAATYTSETPKAAGTVTLTNTGSRRAEYTLIVEAASTSAEALPSALHLAAGALAQSQKCAPDASLDTTGTGAEPLRITGTLEAEATIDLCLRTTLSAEALTAHPDAEIALSLSSSLRYADGDAWTVAAGPATVTQTVGPLETSEPDQPEEPGTPGTGDFVSDGARYTLVHDGACLQRTEVGGTHDLVLEAACNGSQSQWRLTESGDGTFTIDWARNQPSGSLSQPRWTATGAGKSVTFADPRGDDPAQKWIVSAAGADQYRIESVAYPGHVVTVGGAQWNPADTRFLRLSLEPAADLTDQGFRFERVGNPFPELETMKPRGDGPWHVDLTFTRNTGDGWQTGYDQEISYRVFLAPEGAPDARVAHAPGALTGEHTTMQFSPDSVKEYAESAKAGYGNTWVHVEQKLPGGEWSPAAVGKIHISPAIEQNPESMGVYPGWR